MGYTTKLSFDFSSDEKIQSVSDRLADAGVSPCAILVENDFGRPDLKAEEKWVVDACSVAAKLGMKAVRINTVMRPQETVSEAEYAEISTTAIRNILQQTADLDVDLALENHGIMGNRRKFIRQLFEDVGSDRLGLSFDTGNFYWFGYPLEEVYEIIEEFGPRVKHCHVKNLKFNDSERQSQREPGYLWPDSAATIYDGDIDHGRIATILKSVGYDGDLTIEDESLGQFGKDEWIGVIRRDIAFMKSLI